MIHLSWTRQSVAHAQNKLHMWQSWGKSNTIPLRILTTLLRKMRCSAILLLRACYVDLSGIHAFSLCE